jgi:hypothetical protein
MRYAKGYALQIIHVKVYMIKISTKIQRICMRMHIGMLLLLPVACLISCNSISSDNNPQVPQEQLGSSQIRMRMFISPSRIKATNTDSALVTVVACDTANNPLAGYEVTFSASHGIIEASDTTDSSGKAHAVFYSVPCNAEVHIGAAIEVGDSIFYVSNSVTLSGLEVNIRPDRKNALTGSSAAVIISVTDASNEPVGAVEVKTTGTKDRYHMTRDDGVCSTSVSSDSAGTVIITAMALGDTSTDSVRFYTTMPALYNVTGNWALITEMNLDSNYIATYDSNFTHYLAITDDSITYTMQTQRDSNTTIIDTWKTCYRLEGTILTENNDSLHMVTHIKAYTDSTFVRSYDSNPERIEVYKRYSGKIPGLSVDGLPTHPDPNP